MTIEEYIKTHPTWSIEDEFTLDFVNPEDSTEAITNLIWVLNNYQSIKTIATVIRSYYGYTIDWESV